MIIVLTLDKGDLESKLPKHSVCFRTTFGSYFSLILSWPFLYPLVYYASS